MSNIGDMTLAELRRFIVNIVLQDPGALPKQTNQFKNTDVAFGAAIDPAKIAFGAVQVKCSANTNFTTVIDVPGCSTTVNVPGLYLAMGVFDVSFPVNTGNDTVFAFLSAGGVQQTPAAAIRDPNLAAGMRYTIGQNWLVKANPGDIFKLQIQRGGAAGTATVVAGDTTLTILRVS